MASHVISAQVDKRSELLREQDDHSRELDRIVAEITSIEQTIKIFDPSVNLKKFKGKRRYKKNSFFPGRNSSTTVIDVMHEAGKPLNTMEVVEGCAAKLGITIDQETRDALRSTICQTLKKLAVKGVFREAGKVSNGQIVWKLSIKPGLLLRDANAVNLRALLTQGSPVTCLVN